MRRTVRGVGPPARGDMGTSQKSGSVWTFFMGFASVIAPSPAPLPVPNGRQLSNTRFFLSLLFPGSDPCSLLSENPETSLGNGHPVLRRDLWDLTRVLKPTLLTHVQVEAKIFSREAPRERNARRAISYRFPTQLSKQECWIDEPVSRVRLRVSDCLRSGADQHGLSTSSMPASCENLKMQLKTVGLVITAGRRRRVPKFKVPSALGVPTPGVAPAEGSASGSGRDACRRDR